MSTIINLTPVVVHYFACHGIINLTPNLGARLITLGAQKLKGAIWEKPILSGLMHKTIIVTLKH